MRLVNVDLLVDKLAMESMENRTYYRANEIVSESPTAYDVDAVNKLLIAFLSPLVKEEARKEILEGVTSILKYGGIKS